MLLCSPGKRVLVDCPPLFEYLLGYACLRAMRAVPHNARIHFIGVGVMFKVATAAHASFVLVWFDREYSSAGDEEG
eukprot:459621-Amphidinium_carterae.2